MKKVLLLFVLAEVCSAACLALPCDAKVVRDIPYDPSIGSAGLGDLHLPEKVAPETPVVLAIHGGGWARGDRSSVAGMAEFFCRDLGCAVFNIEYRLASRKNHWPACGDDCVKAANWLFSDAFREHVGFSPQKIWICGVSAGGHLALWTLVNMPKDKVAGCISISAIGDPTADFALHGKRYLPLLGKDVREDDLPAINPVLKIDSGMPPILCTHATRDRVVPIASHKAFADAYRAAGNVCEFFEYPVSIREGLTGHCIWIPDSDPRRLIPEIESRIKAFMSGSNAPLSPVKIPKCAKACVCRDLPYGARQVGNGGVQENAAQTYDLYLPGKIGEFDRSAPFFLYVHGGSWKRGSKTTSADLFAEMAEQGFVVASMNYVLCGDKRRDVHTFAEMLADIDAMVSHLPDLARMAGISIPQIALGGSSAGGHLSLLYAYDGANPSVLGLGLKHAVPVACVFSDCGPSDISSPEFIVAGLDWMKGSYDGWCGLLCALAGGQHGQEDVHATFERLAKHSPITLLNGKCPPTICLYGATGSVKTNGTFKREKDGPTETYAAFWEFAGSKETPPESVGMDGIVATQNYVTLTNGLTAAGVPFAARLEPYRHCRILSSMPETRSWLYENLRKYLEKSWGPGERSNEQLRR